MRELRELSIEEICDIQDALKAEVRRRGVEVNMPKNAPVGMRYNVNGRWFVKTATKWIEP